MNLTTPATTGVTTTTTDTPAAGGSPTVATPVVDNTGGVPAAVGGQGGTTTTAGGSGGTMASGGTGGTVEAAGGANTGGTNTGGDTGMAGAAPTGGTGGVEEPVEKEHHDILRDSRGHENGGNFGGIAGADAFCQELAAAVGGDDHTWRAYLSTEGDGAEDARDRIGTGPWTNQAGIVVAENVEQLHTDGISNGPFDGEPDRPQHILDENGAEVPFGGGDTGMHDIVTGTNEDGTVAIGANCNNWSGTEGFVARVGHSDVARIDRPIWNSQHDTASCIVRTDDNRQQSIGSGGGEGRIYCFAID